MILFPEDWSVSFIIHPYIRLSFYLLYSYWVLASCCHCDVQKDDKHYYASFLESFELVEEEEFKSVFRLFDISLNQNNEDGKTLKK